MSKVRFPVAVISRCFPVVAAAGCWPTVGTLFLSLFFGLWMTGSLFAEVRVLTLEEALRIAAEQNKDILKAKEYRKKVLGRYVEEKAAALPQFAATSSLSRDSDNSQKAFGGRSEEHHV
jgi:hypothetical protein